MFEVVVVFLIDQYLEINYLIWRGASSGSDIDQDTARSGDCYQLVLGLVLTGGNLLPSLR